MFNPSFNGYLRFDTTGLEDCKLKHIQEQKFSEKGKMISCNPIQKLTLNTDQIISVSSRTNSPMGATPTECIYIDMANGTRYAMADMYKEDFDNKLLEANDNPNSIIDCIV